VSAHGPQCLCVEPSKVLKFKSDPEPAFNSDSDSDPAFHFDADSDQAFHSDEDSDQAFHSDADSDPALMRNTISMLFVYCRCITRANIKDGPPGPILGKI
jgi:hypothetical protein